VEAVGGQGEVGEGGEVGEDARVGAAQGAALQGQLQKRGHG